MSGKEPDNLPFFGKLDMEDTIRQIDKTIFDNFMHHLNEDARQSMMADYYKTARILGTAK